MASLVDLLRYKEEVEIVHPKTQKPLKRVWVRVLGDYDLNKAYKASRIVSADKRISLRDITSEDYKDEVLGVIDLSREEQTDLVKSSRLGTFVTQAQVAVERPDLPKIEHIAIDGDAASLEELEKFDAEEAKLDTEYRNKIEEFVAQKQVELDAELAALSEEELLKLAQFEVSNILPFSAFMSELADQKLLYGTFKDKTCKEREFDSIEDVKNTPKELKDQLTVVLDRLELGQEEIKN